jgi:hypothetical protein
LIGDGDLDALGAYLADLDEGTRGALLKPLAGCFPEGGYWSGPAHQDTAHALAVLACVSRVDDGVRRLRDRRFISWNPYPYGGVVAVLLRLRGQAWCASLARALVREVRARRHDRAWLFTEELLLAVGAGLPESRAAIAQHVNNWTRLDQARQPDRWQRWTTSELADWFAGHPWFEQVLPYLFDDDLVAAALDDSWTCGDWPSAFIELVASGRLARAPVIDGCLRRLRLGGRPKMLDRYLNLVIGLDLDVGELGVRRQELVGLLTARYRLVAQFAHGALLTLDRSTGLDHATVDEMTRTVLSRPEKRLFRAHVRWLGSRPGDLDPILDALIVGLHHPAPDLAAIAWQLLERNLTSAAGQRLRDEIGSLPAPLAEHIAARLGVAVQAQVPVAAPAAEPVPAMPPPLDLAALAGEVVSVLRCPDDPVRFELLLDGFLRAARGRRADAHRVMKPIYPKTWAPWSDLILATVGHPPPQRVYPQRYQVPVPLDVFVWNRALELAAALVTNPPPALLATPATVAGHVDPERVLSLLRAADRDGWQPGPIDLTQALLRLPRLVDPAIHSAARTLLSPAGRRFAAWLADAGRHEPRTWLEEIPTDEQHHRPTRRLAMLDPGRLPGELAETRDPVLRSTTVPFERPKLGLWPAIAPSHRELIAAHVQQYIAVAEESAIAPATGCLDGLALSDGPPGPAMSSTLAHALGSRRDNLNTAAADALLTLGTRPGWTSTGVGTELAILATSGRIVLRRAVTALNSVSRAGAHHTIAEIANAALPTLLAATARPGTTELISLAASAARAGQPIANTPELTALATRHGNGQLIQAGQDLASLLHHTTT